MYKFMWMFPDATIGATGNAANIAQSAPQKKEVNTEQQQEVSVSVFSNYDSSKDKKVDFSEAKTNSLFQKANLNNNAANTLSGLTQGQQNTILNQTLKNFNVSQQLEGLLSKFSVKTGEQKMKFANGQVEQAKVNDAAKQMDNTAQTAWANESKNANIQLQQMFETALKEAAAELNAENKLDGAEVENTQLDEGNQKALDGNSAKAKEFDEAQNTNSKTKIKTTVYSSYDTNKDSSVNGQEAQNSGLLKMEHKTEDFNVAGRSADVSNTIKASMSTNIEKMYQEAFSKFNVNVSDTIKETLHNAEKSEITESQLSDIMAKLDTKVENKAKSFQTSVNKQVAKDYQQALNKVTKEYDANPSGIKAKADAAQAGQDNAKAGLNEDIETSPEVVSVEESEDEDNGSEITEQILDEAEVTPESNSEVTDKFANWNRSYTVKAGDTLSGIAKRECGGEVNFREIAEANDIKNVNIIRIGQKLKLPNKEG